MPFLRRFIKIIIALFVVWHIVAVFVYSLYHVEGTPILEWMNSKRNYVRPYILITSQWQRWNLFSPDPLRRVIEMKFDRQVSDETWVNIYTLNEKTVGWWQRAPELKIMRRMEDENNEPLQERYVHDLCRTRGIPAGTRMRLRKRWFIIPKNEVTQSTAWWNAWEPDWREMELLQTTCPSIP
ncbi:hypothetical protein CL635_00785 [bacterium]|jgi:hypothetical protein|nr:hypothetical protein [bacterium]|tara:strand:- start:6113 stop:6658 length:546 start_codon:yes stop_codon:yes gene_type:complete